MQHTTKHAAHALAITLALTGCGPEVFEEEYAETGEEGHEHGELAEVSEALTGFSPVPGRGVTTPFGRPGSWAAGYHTGDDYAAPTGARVIATRAGRVVFVGWGGWGSAYGNHVILETGGVRHLYAHLSQTSVRSGQTVEAGAQIGAVGSTGRSTGPHLHYEERVAPFGYYDHRRPQFNRAPPSGSAPSAPPGGASGQPSEGYKNWIYGRSHPDVRGLQRALISAGCAIPDAYSDHYGDQTRDAVACFQRNQGWSGAGADGRVGPETARRLWLVGDVYVGRLTRGVTDSDSVRMLQQRLNEVRDAGLPITGNYGERTQEAVRAWQRSIGDAGAAADGNMGPRQTQRLFEAHRYTVR